MSIKKPQAIYRCRSCRERWVQSGRDGMCTRCWKGQGHIAKGVVEREAVLVAREQARIDALKPTIIPRDRRYREVNGTVYEVIWP